MRNLTRWLIRLALAGALITLVVRLLRRGEPEAPDERWHPLDPDEQRSTSVEPASSQAMERAPSHELERPASTEIEVSQAPWVEPDGANCPASHPVKAKESSGIFHVPGGRSYDRTRPDRCYIDAAAAEGDGFRPAKA